MYNHTTSLDKLSAVPGETNPIALLLNYQTALQQSLLIFIKNIQVQLRVDLDTLIERIATLQPSKRFTPALFYYYDTLKEGYRAKNLHNIFDALHFLQNLDEFYREELIVGTILEQSWENPVVNEFRQTRLMEGERNLLPGDPQMLPLIHWQKNDYPPSGLSQAIDDLFMLDVDLACEFKTYVSTIKLFIGKYLNSTTSARAFGTLWMRVPNADENPELLYFDYVIHELSHLHLYTLMAIDPLILNKPDELFSSPLREDKRPMNGILHAVFVLARLVRLLKRLNQGHTKSEMVQQLLDKREKEFQEGYAVVSQHASWTEMGYHLYSSLQQCAYA